MLLVLMAIHWTQIPRLTGYLTTGALNATGAALVGADYRWPGLCDLSVVQTGASAAIAYARGGAAVNGSAKLFGYFARSRAQKRKVCRRKIELRALAPPKRHEREKVMIDGLVPRLKQTQRASPSWAIYTSSYSHLAMQARRASRVALVACACGTDLHRLSDSRTTAASILLRVQDGKVSSLDGSGSRSPDSASKQPDNAEKLSFVNTFLSRFVNIDPLTVKRDTLWRSTR